MSNDKNWAGKTPLNTRLQLTPESFEAAINAVRSKLEYRQKQKGMGTYSSCHETLGIIKEEFNEYLDEVHIKNDVGQLQELADIAVACIWGIASITSGGQDW